MTATKNIVQSVYNDIRTNGIRTGISIVTDKQNNIIDTKGENVLLNLESEDLMELINNNLKVLSYDRKRK